ncbi:Receptor-binding cancer antigen, partial [Stegodyphus mimosarum]
MNVVKNLLCRFGHLLLNVIQAIRRAICCRKRKEPEYILPLTITHVVDMEQNKWDVWPETENRVPLNNSNTVRSDKEPESSMFQQQQLQQQDEQEDFFKDMVPQIRKPKKLYIRNEVRDSDQARSSSNRLAMDPKAILPGPDLGVIEDNPSNWESENLDEIWDPDVLLKESKMAERE